MLNYLKAELWRYFRRPAGKALLILSFVLPAALVLYVWGGNRWIDSENPITLAETWAIASILMPFAGILFLMAIVDAAFADENRLGTMKNSVAAGFSRWIVYSGKILSGILLSVLHLACAWGSFLLAGMLLLPFGIPLRALLLRLGLLLLEIIPLWLGVLGILYLVYFSFRNGLVAAIAAAAGSFLIMVALLSLNVYAAEVLAQLQLIIYFFSVVLENSLLTDFSDLQVDRLFLAKCWLVGGGYFLACAAAGWLLFRGRDIS